MLHSLAFLRPNFLVKSAYFSVLFALAMTAGSAAFAADVDGIYVGYMDLKDGEARRIPLSVSLTLTNESVETPRGTQFVTDGAALIDEEGGPYTFTKVGYDIDDNTVEMRYSRPEDDTNSAPASFRLSGKFTGESQIEGRVLSGTYANIGTFKIIKDPNLTMLVPKQKYIGAWKGTSYNRFARKNFTMTLFINKGAVATVNPNGSEFDFTPGRTAGYEVETVNIANFSMVSIDYLRRTALLQDQSKSMSISLKFDFENRTISGEQYSAMHGHTSTFKNLKLIPLEAIPSAPR